MAMPFIHEDRIRNFFRSPGFYLTGGAATAGAKRWHRFPVLAEEESHMVRKMSKQWVAVPLAALLLLGASNGAEAKGCIKGAAVGAVAGHFARHHGLIGAAAGCVVGHHMAKKKQREEEKERREQQRRQAGSSGR